MLGELVGVTVWSRANAGGRSAWRAEVAAMLQVVNQEARSAGLRLRQADRAVDVDRGAAGRYGASLLTERWPGWRRFVSSARS